MKKPASKKHLARETASPAPEIETADWLAKQGWERVSLVFEIQSGANGDSRETEILADSTGQLWIVTDYSGKGGITYRAERRKITGEAAAARMARASIPDKFHGDFRECRPPKSRLETAIKEARAFLILMAHAECGRVGSYTGQKREAFQAGIVSLLHSLGDELAAAFYAAEDAA